MKKHTLGVAGPICAALLSTTAPALAGPVVAWSFVDPVNGNDSTCATQASTNGAITPVPPLTVTPCRTLTKACALVPQGAAGSGSDAGNWVIEGFPGSLVEASVCHASGHDPLNTLQLIARNPGAGNGGPLYIKSPTISSPAMEITGSFVYVSKWDFRGSPGNALYMHGTDSQHNAVDDVVGYNTYFDGNGGYAVYLNYTYWGLMFGDNVYNNGANAGSKGCILIEESTFPLITNTGITNCGSLTGVPVTPIPGTVFLKDTYPQYLYNTAMSGDSVNVSLIDSFQAQIARDPTKPAQKPFTWEVTAVTGVGTCSTGNPTGCSGEAAYELSTDSICNIATSPWCGN